MVEYMSWLFLIVYKLSFFRNAELFPLVEYNEKKLFEVKLKEMKSAVTIQIAEEAGISEVIETVKQQVKDAKLPDVEVVGILWDVLMDAVQWRKQLLNTFCTSGKLELELIYKVQVQCYEDAKLMKLFPEILRQALVKSLEPFVKWLEEAEEEE
ncbi:hypothetical protein HAX54_006328 [Datura stramonium]|uniref:W2 domain-containing protein n=1 Tax=Datura stramonium TaxID=4076 RepID=A0ABS8WTZ1_DATST|nr:hypothetical protein [Datura stramonium]